MKTAACIAAVLLTACAGPESVYDIGNYHPFRKWTAAAFNETKEIHGGCTVGGGYIVSCATPEAWGLAQVYGLTPPVTARRPAAAPYRPTAAPYRPMPEPGIDPVKEWRRSMFYDPVTDSLMPHL